MNTRIHVCVLSIAILLAGFGGPAGPAYGSSKASPGVFDIPQVSGITVDGDDADWQDSGFRVDIMPNRECRTQPRTSLDPCFRLAWDERGLLVLVKVADDVFMESSDESMLWEKDSIEVFMATKRGAPDYYQLVISPGVTPEYPELRIQAVDLRKKEPRAPLTHEVVRKKGDKTYTVEMVLPWSNLGLTPKLGDEVGFQIYVTDVDGPVGRFQAVWFPSVRARYDSREMWTVRLARRPSPPDNVRVSGEYDELARSQVHVLTVSESVGTIVRVKQGARERARGVLTESGGYARAELRFPMPGRDGSAKPWRVYIGGEYVSELSLPSPDVVRAQRIMLLSMAARPPVFKGEGFPPCDFADPLLAERLLGPYHIAATFYDRDFNPVVSADVPGRYGAILKIEPESGSAFYRYLTLFRAPESFDTLFSWWCLDPQLSVRFPAEAAPNPSVVSAHRESLGAYFKLGVLDDFVKGQDAAVLFAGLFEAQSGDASGADLPPVTVTDDVWAMDRQWWVTLKRKLNGMDKAYPNPFVCPYEKEGDPAPELRAGTLEEACMKPEAADKIDVVCQEWSEASQEPFAVCLARHGVVFFHKAYGERYGEPITVDTKSWMASISKFLSGGLMMTLVDQGLVDVDAPVDKYLPSLRGISVKYPLTVRHLYTHTSGLGLGLQPARMFIDHWGDERNDFEEIVAGYYPYLEVGSRLAYNGVGHALGGKIMESVSGEAFPQFFKRHLWGPLGCDHTDAVDGSARTMSTSMDIARFGQMILNRGAYGKKRFFSEAAFEKMLPVKLAPYVHFDTDVEWGIGPVWMADSGLSKRTIGHGAASGATFRIDLDNDLIIVMTRNTSGPQYAKYHPLFIQAVADSMMKEEGK